MSPSGFYTDTKVYRFPTCRQSHGDVNNLPKMLCDRKWNPRMELGRSQKFIRLWSVFSSLFPSFSFPSLSFIATRPLKFSYGSGERSKPETFDLFCFQAVRASVRPCTRVIIEDFVSTIPYKSFVVISPNLQFGCAVANKVKMFRFCGKVKGQSHDNGQKSLC